MRHEYEHYSGVCVLFFFVVNVLIHGWRELGRGGVQLIDSSARDVPPLGSRA